MAGFWQVSKIGNSALWPCHFGKCLLTVGGDEQQENAISPSILNVFVVCFFEHIPYMYVLQSQYGLLHYAILISQTGLVIFFSTYLI